MKLEECHYYEPNFKYFESCPVTLRGLDAITEHCLNCRYNIFDEATIKASSQPGVAPDAISLDDFDFELDATADTLCGRMGRKHKMKRIHHSLTKCIYTGCEGYC